MKITYNSVMDAIFGLNYWCIPWPLDSRPLSFVPNHSCYQPRVCSPLQKHNGQFPAATVSHCWTCPYPWHHKRQWYHEHHGNRKRWWFWNALDQLCPTILDQRWSNAKIAYNLQFNHLALQFNCTNFLAWISEWECVISEREKKHEGTEKRNERSGVKRKKREKKQEGTEKRNERRGVKRKKREKKEQASKENHMKRNSYITMA